MEGVIYSDMHLSYLFEKKINRFNQWLNTKKKKKRKRNTGSGPAYNVIGPGLVLLSPAVRDPRTDTDTQEHWYSPHQLWPRLATPVAHAAGTHAMAARGSLAAASPPASPPCGSLLRCGSHRPHTTPAPPRP